MVEPIEEEIMEQLFRVGDLHVNDLMVDRTDIVWLNVADSLETLHTKIAAGAHSRYPVARGDLDNIIGLVFVKDLLVQKLRADLSDLEGLVTFMDLLEAIVGDVPEAEDPANPTAIRRTDGSWLIDGKLPIEEFKQIFKVDELPDESENYYQTIGGFVMSYLGRIPEAGDLFAWRNLTFEVMDMNWRRMDKVLVTEKE